jgi:Tfp pilus assembly protein PilO
MSKSQKILLISLLPALLTLIFIMYAVMPALGSLTKAKNELKAEKTSFSETQDKLNTLRENKKLMKRVEELRDKLANFEIQVPLEDDLAILLVDIEKFSNDFNVKVYNIESSPEKPIEIVDPKQEESKDKQPSKKKKKNKDTSEELPINLFKIPLNILVKGNYPSVLSFINAMENYERKITINGIALLNDKKDESGINPKIEMEIDCTVYKLVENKVSPDEPKNEDKS